MMIISGKDMEPIYYMGRVIQPTPNGYYVIEGETRFPSDIKFDELEEAYRYIDHLTGQGR